MGISSTKNNRAKALFSNINKGVISKSRQLFLLLCSAFARPPIDYCAQFCLLRRMQANGNRLRGEGAERMTEQELETKSQEERLNKLVMFRKEDRRVI